MSLILYMCCYWIVMDNAFICIFLYHYYMELKGETCFIMQYILIENVQSKLLLIRYCCFFYREANRRAHSKPGSVPHTAERKKTVISEVKWYMCVYVCYMDVRMLCVCCDCVCNKYDEWQKHLRKIIVDDSFNYQSWYFIECIANNLLTYSWLPHSFPHNML